MAIRYAVGNGNVSAAATWNGGTVLASGDYAYANGYAVTIDADVNIGSGTLSTEVCPATGIGGGSFPFTTSRTIVADIKAGTSTALTSTTAGITLTIIGNYYGGSSSNAIAISARAITINVTGNGYGGNGVDANGIRTGSYVSVINQTGNVTGGGGGVAIYQVSSSAVCSIVGNLSAGVMPAIRYGSLLDITGVAQSSETASACVAHEQILNNVCSISGACINVLGIMAINGMVVYITSPTNWTYQDGDGNDIVLMSSTTFENPPAESDVREGVVYGIADAYEGTLSVGATPAEFVAALVASDLGLRMAKCAVTEEVLTMLENLE